MKEILRLTDDRLQFMLYVEASATISDRVTGRHWQMGPVVHQEDNPVDAGHVWMRQERSLCEQYPGRFRMTVEGDHLRVAVIQQLGQVVGTFACRYALEGGSLVFTLLQVDESLPSLIYPPAIVAESLVMPLGVGTWFRKPIQSRRIARFYSGGLNMRWFGGLAQGDADGWIAIMEKSHEDSGISFTQRHASPLFLRSLGTWRGESFPRVIRYRFTQGGYVGIATAFRQFAIANGLHRTLHEKLAQTPSLTHLIGGRELNCYLGDSESGARCEDHLQPVPEDLRERTRIATQITCREYLQIISEAKGLGMKKGIAMLRGWVHGGYDDRHPDVWPPESAFGTLDEYRRIVSGAAGFSGGLHDNYGDMYAHAPSFPHGVLRRPDGSLKRGGYWAGGQCYLLDPREGLAYAQRNWQLIKTLEPTKIYSDTITAMYLDESFAPGRTLTRAQDLVAKQDLMRFFKSVGVILASEEGADFGGALLDTVDTTHKRHCTADSVSIPLWPLVYHDAVLCGRHNTTPADANSQTPWHVTNLLWGYFTMWALPSARDWQTGFADTFCVETFNERTALDAMTQHRFVDIELMVEQTEFSSGASVVANYGDSEVTVHGKRIEAHSALVIA